MATNMKATIAQALGRLMTQKDVDKITVTDIVESCNISRQTFYYHFQDMTQVMEWSLQQIMQDTLQKSLKATEPEDAIKIFIDEVLKNRFFVNKLLDSQRRKQIELMLVTALQTYLHEIADNKLPRLDIEPEDLDLTLRFYSFAIGGIILEMVLYENSDSEIVAKKLVKIMELHCPHIQNNHV